MRKKRKKKRKMRKKKRKRKRRCLLSTRPSFRLTEIRASTAAAALGSATHSTHRRFCCGDKQEGREQGESGRTQEGKSGELCEYVNACGTKKCRDV